MITIHDDVYGIISLEEAVLEQLIATPAVQRLRHISQSGISGLLGISPNFSRFEHSVGVMLLLRLCGAPLKEQIAGLLHDISHTAFSHVADFVYGDHEISYHDRKWHEVVAQSAIPTILERHGYTWQEMEGDSDRFPLLEQPQPHLCADRVDYFLRTLIPAGMGTPEQLRWLLSRLATYRGRIVVTDPAAARWMADRYLEMDRAMWSSPREAALYWMLARAMREAVEAGYILEEDWYQTDWELWKQLHRIRDSKVAQPLSYVRSDTIVTLSQEQYDFVTRTKVRTIDPSIVVKDECWLLSELDPSFAARRKAHLRERSEPMALWVSHSDTISPWYAAGKTA